MSPDFTLLEQLSRYQTLLEDSTRQQTERVMAFRDQQAELVGAVRDMGDGLRAIAAAIRDFATVMQPLVDYWVAGVQFAPPEEEDDS